MKTPGKTLLGGVETPQAIRAMLLSLLVACGILSGGMFWTYRVGLEANTYDHRLDHAQEAVEALHQTEQDKKVGIR